MWCVFLFPDLVFPKHLLGGELTRITEQLVVCCLLLFSCVKEVKEAKKEKKKAVVTRALPLSVPDWLVYIRRSLLARL